MLLHADEPLSDRARALRLAIQKALMQLEELETRRAYERWPQDLPDKWSVPPRKKTKK
jgi:hypothetical protein